jgi:hypothetical protein
MNESSTPLMTGARFHGVFAPNFKQRERIVPQRAHGTVDRDKPVAPMSWMQRFSPLTSKPVPSAG